MIRGDQARVGLKRRGGERGVREDEGHRADPRRLLDQLEGAVGHVHHDAQPVAFADHIRAERAQPAPLRVLGLLIAELARHVVHDLELADAAAIHLLDPLETAVHEVAALDGDDERGPPGRFRGVEIGRGQHARHAVRPHQGIHEGQPLPRELVELAGRGITILADAAAGRPANDRPIRGMAQAHRRHPAAPHVIRQIVPGRPREARARGVAVHVHRDRPRQHAGHPRIQLLQLPPPNPPTPRHRKRRRATQKRPPASAPTPLPATGSWARILRQEPIPTPTGRVASTDRLNRSERGLRPRIPSLGGGPEGGRSPPPG